MIERELRERSEGGGVGEDAVSDVLDVRARDAEHVAADELVGAAREERVQAAVEEDVNEVRRLGRSVSLTDPRTDDARSGGSAGGGESTLEQTTTGEILHVAISRAQNVRNWLDDRIDAQT